MTNPDEKCHVMTISPPPAGQPRKLSFLDELPLREFIDERSGDAIMVVVRQVNAWADGMTAPATRDAERVEMLATMIAVHRAKLLLLEARRDDAVEQRDVVGAAMLEKALEGTSRRLVALVAEHRASCSNGHRSVNVTTIAVGDGQQVNVAAGFAQEPR